MNVPHHRSHRGGQGVQVPSAAPQISRSEARQRGIGETSEIICHPDVTGTERGQVTLFVPERVSQHQMAAPADAALPAGN